MGWFGKIVGGTIGFALGGPVGAAIGAGIGHVTHDEEEETNGRRARNSTHDAALPENADDYDDSSDDEPEDEADGEDTESDELLADSSFWDDPIGTFHRVTFDHELPANAIVCCRVLDEDGYYVAAAAPYADRDGDFVVAASLADGAYEFFIPHTALLGAAGQTGSMVVDVYEPGVSRRHGRATFSLTIKEVGGWSVVEFLEPIIHLCMAVAHADGTLNPHEVRFVRTALTEDFEIPEHEARQLRDTMKQGTPPDLDDCVLRLVRRLPRLDHRNVLDLLAAVARADGRLSNDEVDVIQRVSESLGFDDEEWSDIADELHLYDDDDASAPANKVPDLDVRVTRTDDPIGTSLEIRPSTSLPADTTVVVHLQRGNDTYVRAVSPFADKDGDFCAIEPLRDGVCRVYVPFSALHAATGATCTLWCVFYAGSPREGVARARTTVTIGQTDCWNCVAFYEPLVQLCMAVAHADGEVSRDEIKLAKQRISDAIDLQPDDQDALRHAMKQGAPADLESALALLRRRVSGLSADFLIALLADVAKADGEVTTAEVQTIRRIATALGVVGDAWDAAVRTHGLASWDPYEVLGLSRSASAADVKRAYRERVAQYHPDRVASLPREFQQLATDKTMELRKAYETILARLDRRHGSIDAS